MRILVIDPDQTRAALIREGLGEGEMHVAASLEAADLDDADVVVIACELMQTLRADLAKARADLSDRKTIERAKGVLMKERGLDEEAAYRLLRKLAMDSGRPLGAVASDLIAYAGVLKGGGA